MFPEFVPKCNPVFNRGSNYHSIEAEEAVASLLFGLKLKTYYLLYCMKEARAIDTVHLKHLPLQWTASFIPVTCKTQWMYQVYTPGNKLSIPELS